MILTKSEIGDILLELNERGALAICLTTFYVSVDVVFLKLHDQKDGFNGLDELLKQYTLDSAKLFHKTLKQVGQEQTTSSIKLRLKNGNGIKLKMKFVNTSRGPGIYAEAEAYDFTPEIEGLEKVRNLLLEEKEALQQQLLTADANLKDALAELERFSYIAAHDLKTPLRIMVSFLNLVQNRLVEKGVEDELVEEYMKFVVDSGKEMAKLLDNILDYIKLNKVETKALDLNEVLLPIVEQAIKKYPSKKIYITSDPLPVDHFDRQHLGQIFHNLLDNSIKYNESDIIFIHISYTEKENEHLFAVNDNGIGIDPRYHEKIFGIFQRLHRKDEYDGTGIGLAMCKKIIDLYQGDIWTESEAGSGAKLIFTLPRKQQLQNSSKAG